VVIYLTKMDHKDHLKAMKCHFHDIMKDAARDLDSARYQIEESMVIHDLIPGKSVDETNDSVIVKVIMPGIKKENLDLNITESQMIIEATFSMENNVKGSFISFEDKQKGTIKRKISLPKKVIPQEASAKLENGILRVEIPKLEKEEQFKVKID
jgi:HSP20 family protein